MKTLRRRAGRRDRFHPSFLIRGPYRDYDLVGWKGCECVANRQVNICFACLGLDGLAGKVGGHVFCDALRVTERLLVIGEPVEHPLTHDGYHDFQLVAFTDVPPQHIFWMIDGTDDEDISHNVSSMPAFERRRNHQKEGTRRRPLAPSDLASAHHFLPRAHE
jgi:hypothetical protein